MNIRDTRSSLMDLYRRVEYITVPLPSNPSVVMVKQYIPRAMDWTVVRSIVVLWVAQFEVVSVDNRGISELIAILQIKCELSSCET